jgi:hypothetical protein
VVEFADRGVGVGDDFPVGGDEQNAGTVCHEAIWMRGPANVRVCCVPRVRCAFQADACAGDPSCAWRPKACEPPCPIPALPRQPRAGRLPSVAGKRFSTPLSIAKTTSESKAIESIGTADYSRTTVRTTGSETRPELSTARNSKA